MEAARRMRRAVLAGIVAVPTALTAVIGIEMALLSRREYLPPDPGYRVDLVLRPRDGTADATPVRLAVLGDSTVAGVGAPTAGESLPALVAQRVADALDRPVHVVGYGISGARTASLTDVQLPTIGAEHDVVLLVIGANDATHATPWPAFDAQTRTMLARATASGVPVVLGSTPRFIGTKIIPQPLRFMVDGYSAILRGIQRAAVEDVPGTRLVDLSVVARRFDGVPEATSSDGFHPSPIGYGFWADALAPGVVAALAGR